MSSVIGIDPDEVGRIGEPRGIGTLRYSTNIWTIKAPVAEPTSAGDSIGSVVARCLPRADAFLRLAGAGATVTLHVVIYSSSNIGFAIDPISLAHLAALGAAVDVDTYWTST